MGDMVKRYNLRGKDGRFTKLPKTLRFTRGRYFDKEGKRISQREAQRRARISAGIRPGNFLVLFTTFETKKGKRTGLFLQIEIIVRAESLEDAENVAFRLVGDSIPEPLLPLWEGTDWMIGVQRVKKDPSKRAVFRKFSKPPRAEIYVTSWDV